jgi:competence ComEA-like helix-hairpin-helix protein
VSLFTRLQEAIGFTRTEAQVLLFLSGTFILGLGLKYLRDPALTAPTDLPSTHRSDSTFAARSAIANDPSRVPVTAAAARTKTPPAAGSININTSSKEELMRLPGIGPAYAGRILAFRAEHGPFRTLEELQNVKGIGPKTFERIKPFLRLH